MPPPVNAPRTSEQPAHDDSLQQAAKCRQRQQTDDPQIDDQSRAMARLENVEERQQEGG
jgi:hypothetical protein